VSYAQLEAEQQAFYSSQEGELGDKAITQKNFKDFEYPVRLILGKSAVGGSVTGDVFEGVSAGPIPFVPVRGYAPGSEAPLGIEIGDPWHFYSFFWKAHDLDRMARLIPEPEVATRIGDTLSLPLLACNRTVDGVELEITAALPSGWTEQTGFLRYPVRPGECYPIQAQVAASAAAQKGWQELTWTATAGTQTAGSVKVRVYVGSSGGLPQ
jgi:hypothetical protein